MLQNKTFSAEDLPSLCDALANDDQDLARIVSLYGYPLFWHRPNNFESLVHIILEQQVSLASAKAALEKLRLKIGDITPIDTLRLSDEEMKAAYFSRQKMSYVRDLAQRVIDGRLDIEKLGELSDQEIREALVEVKGIGNWTVDVYLIMVLHRRDFFPIGDIAAINALKRLKGLPQDTSHEELLAIASRWKPYRSVATMLLWHFYLSERSSKQARKTA